LTFLSTKTDQFTYFAQQVGESMWRGKHVLDFGGNIGNILRDPNCTIDEERYWCIDVDAESVEVGKIRFPRSHWIYYDRYCFYFNARGVPQLPLPRIEQRFDYIVAYSVFTNTPLADMRQLVSELEELLTENGTLAFTFIDPHHIPWPGEYDGDNFHWRLNREGNDCTSAEGRAMLARAAAADYCVLVNGNALYVGDEEIPPVPPEQQRSWHVFHTVELMRSLYPRAEIMAPANGEMQHCCVIRKDVSKQLVA
jgi:hypothetical protein